MWKTQELNAPSQRSQQTVSKTEKSQRDQESVRGVSRVCLSCGGGGRTHSAGRKTAVFMTTGVLLLPLSKDAHGYAMPMGA